MKKRKNIIGSVLLILLGLAKPWEIRSRSHLSVCPGLLC